jgi:hypothetical protein
MRWHPFLPALGLLAAAAAAASLRAEDPPGPFVREGVPHPGSDQIYWVPTFAQAQRLAARTGRLILVMGSVSDFSGY